MQLNELHIKTLVFFSRQTDFVEYKNIPLELTGLGYQQEFKETLYQLIGNKLLDSNTYRSNSTTAKDSYKISENGLELIKPHIERHEKKEVVERLEFEKLQEELYKIRNEVNDYTGNKTRAIFTFWLAVVAVVISIIALFKQV